MAETTTAAGRPAANETISVRLSLEDKQLVGHLAARKGLSRSAWMRDTIREEAQRAGLLNADTGAGTPLDPKAHIVEILEKLEKNLSDGWTAFQLAKRLREGFRAGQLPPLGALFGDIYTFCLREAISALARLWDSHKDAIRLDHLLNYSNTYPEAYPNIPTEHVNRAVEEQRKRISNNALRSQVMNLRNNLLHHTAKKQITKPAEIRTDPIDLCGMEAAYLEIVSIVNVFDGFHGKEITLGFIEQDVETKVAYLVRVWKKAEK